MIAMLEVVKLTSVSGIVVLASFVARRCYAVEEQIRDQGIENFWPFARE